MCKIFFLHLAAYLMTPSVCPDMMVLAWVSTVVGAHSKLDPPEGKSLWLRTSLVVRSYTLTEPGPHTEEQSHSS